MPSRHPALVALVAALAPAALETAPASGTAAPEAPAAGAPRVQLPAQFAVRGAPLARRHGTIAGRRISVYAKPAAVAVDGCRSRSARVSVHGRRASLSVLAICKGTRSRLRIRATIAGRRMRGTAGSRRFRAALVPPRGKILRGRERAPALSAVGNTNALRPHSDSEFSSGKKGRDIARTEIVLRIERDATVGQVNAALLSAGGRIAGALAGSPRLVVSIPDTGSLKVLEKVLAALAKRPGIADALASERASTQELPPGFGAPPSASRRAEISHLIAMRMPAAWNARRAVRQADRPALIVADTFGGGPPSSSLIDGPIVAADYLSGSPRAHGYHVLGIVAAKFSNSGSAAGRVTGVFPARARLTVLDMVGATLDGAAIQVLNAVRAQPGRVVVNTSLGHNPATDDANARQEGSDWARQVRLAGLADRLLHAGSAGNDAVSATRNSPWVSAALRTDLTDLFGDRVAPLSQTLAVENVVDTGSPAYEPGCLAVSSNRGGNIAAVGTNVFSFKLNGTTGNDSGTSQASPQVAGLAEYMWSIAPDLAAGQLADAIQATAAPPLSSGPPCNTDLPSAPRLDAYNAVLSLDEAGPPTAGGSPVRLALLDINGDNAFNQTDLQTWVQRLPAADPPSRTWGRPDLNGDGFVGGTRTAAFDLDRGGSTRAGAATLDPVSRAIEGSNVNFDEHAVTDIQVVCFYAYSGLYTGDPDQRRSVLDPVQRCGASAEQPESENCTSATAFGKPATIVGGSGPDTIQGTAGDDVIIGGGGDDFIRGMEGNDRVCGGEGDDFIQGGFVNDDDDPDGPFNPMPPINSGDDLLDGGPGIDRVNGTGGNDRVFGGDDSDSVIGGSPGADFMDGGPGGDDVCSRGEIPRDGGAGGSDSFGPGCEFINNF